MYRRTLLVCLALPGLLLAPHSSGAQEHPADEPSMIDIPDQENLALGARAELSRGDAAVKRAEKALEEADEVEGKKREKLEKKAQKAWEEAEQHYLATIRGDAEIPEAYVGLGRVWLATGQTQKALQAWGAAQKRMPEDPETLYGLGHTLVELDRPSDAASVYVGLRKVDEARAGELLAELRAWGEPRAAEGDQVATDLLAWIDEQD